MTAARRTVSGSDFLPQFKEIAERFSALAALEGIRVIPYRDPALVYFSSLAPSEQKGAIEALNLLVEAAQTVRQQGGRIRDSRAFAWSFFKHSPLKPPADLYEFMTDNWMVILYNRHNQLVFASLDFFEASRSSLEDLYCRSWTEVYRRDDEELERAVLELCSNILAGHFPGPFRTDGFPAHVVRETIALEERAILIQSRVMSPLLEHGGIGGYFAAGEILEVSDVGTN